jgi:transcriptional regulator GlxA family with amidase domain
MRVAVVVFEGFDELDAIGPLEVLRNAAAMGATDLSVELVALDGAAEVTGSHGLRVRTDGRLDPDRTDLLVIPGGGWNDHGALEDLRASGARVVEARVVDDGDLVTAGGVTSGIDLALWLVERHFGAKLAEAVAAEIEHPRHGEVWRAG